MFFATTTQPQLRRQAYANSGRTLERFMDEALRTTASKSCAYSQDETSFTLTLDVPGVAREQLSIAIEGAVVRIASKEGAPRTYSAAYEFPQDIDTALSEAKLENGVLSLKLTKKVPVSNATELVVH
ncbi:MAG TPA: Hsp20/alpha crystallin family protein [Rhodoferax sp.]|jgi:HSP20 family molecular chaperone IbpA|nr:Hsp20/alpha crystallin family protein [Rhodoferax sp.]HNV58668.1 Hsp20/alpha crystallin family protein [Rhodoferax sp.]